MGRGRSPTPDSVGGKDVGVILSPARDSADNEFPASPLQEPSQEVPLPSAQYRQERTDEQGQICLGLLCEPLQAGGRGLDTGGGLEQPVSLKHSSFLFCSTDLFPNLSH